MPFLNLNKTFNHQGWHLIALLLLVFLLHWYAQTHVGMTSGGLWGLSTTEWMLLTVIIPVLHQVYVMLCWRIELYQKGISKSFGKRGFTLYKIGFAILILLRPVTLILLAVSNQGTIRMASYLAYTIAVILLIPSLYLFYSVKTYFGINRAFGIDHFYPDEYKTMGFVRKGIFKFTSNGMYLFGFLILWVPGILLKSEAAIALAIFSHIYIWVHYYCTERPDMKSIYGKENRGTAG